MTKDCEINYIELPAQNIKAVKSFFEKVFNWSFTDYGPEYSAFSNSGIDGGFFQSNLSSKVENGSVLVVFYSKNLEKTQSKIEKYGGKIVKKTFYFPGGRRFHFCDPNENEYAVWSDSDIK